MSDEFTPEQKSAVVRVMKLKVTDYYGILRVEKTCTSAEIKRAYKKQALLMHPDKNKAPNADEAFKRIAKAFQVLSDAEKRKLFDQTGQDPDSRGGMGAGPGGFGGQPFGGGSPFGPRFARAAPADDIFAQFFGGPNMGGQPFQFQFGGDPSDLFSSMFGEALFGGARTSQARRRQQAARNAQEAEANRNMSTYMNLMIIAAVLVLPTLLSWIFDSSSTSSVPGFRFDPRKPFTEERSTPTYHVPFYVNPKDLEDLSESKLKTLDRTAEKQFVSNTRSACTREYLSQQQQMQDAVGWLFTDEEKFEEARNRPLPNCDILTSLGIRLRE